MFDSSDSSDLNLKMNCVCLTVKFLSIKCKETIISHVWALTQRSHGPWRQRRLRWWCILRKSLYLIINFMPFFKHIFLFLMPFTALWLTCIVVLEATSCSSLREREKYVAWHAWKFINKYKYYYWLLWLLHVDKSISHTHTRKMGIVRRRRGGEKL